MSLLDPTRPRIAAQPDAASQLRVETHVLPTLASERIDPYVGGPDAGADAAAQWPSVLELAASRTWPVLGLSPANDPRSCARHRDANVPSLARIFMRSGRCIKKRTAKRCEWLGRDLPRGSKAAPVDRFVDVVCRERDDDRRDFEAAAADAGALGALSRAVFEDRLAAAALDQRWRSSEDDAAALKAAVWAGALLPLALVCERGPVEAQGRVRQHAERLARVHVPDHDDGPGQKHAQLVNALRARLVTSRTARTVFALSGSVCALRLFVVRCAAVEAGGGDEGVRSRWRGCVDGIDADDLASPARGVWCPTGALSPEASASTTSGARAVRDRPSPPPTNDPAAPPVASLPTSMGDLGAHRVVLDLEEEVAIALTTQLLWSVRESTRALAIEDLVDATALAVVVGEEEALREPPSFPRRDLGAFLPFLAEGKGATPDLSRWRVRRRCGRSERAQRRGPLRLDPGVFALIGEPARDLLRASTALRAYRAPELAPLAPLAAVQYDAIRRARSARDYQGEDRDYLIVAEDTLRLARRDLVRKAVGALVGLLDRLPEHERARFTADIARALRTRTLDPGLHAWDDAGVGAEAAAAITNALAIEEYAISEALFARSRIEEAVMGRVRMQWNEWPGA